ncbi:MAG: cysteine methyltransferase [Agrobacterium fabrum]|uniref:methylated-DNA--[protein]-cysteine S-methyltransferase n=1 Tax=Agrobacterium fabrum TaxID=1176649 RepID=A0A2W5H7W7_9HYPH|nr:MAG: cysteine methyltransferase [Agrobacterium fabrum]
MNLMIKTDTLRSNPQVNSASTAADVISYAVADSDLGKVLVASSAKGVCSILLGDNAEELAADLADRFPRSSIVANEAAVKGDVESVLRYIAKPSDGLNLTLDMRGTPFQRRVWEKLKAISAGRTVSYTELAHWMSPLANPRAVASACAANPIALAIPCHRVVRTNGDLAGYRWGIERKRELIRREAMA